MARHPKVTVTCQACGKTFDKHYCKLAQYNFCSRKCMSVDCIPATCTQCGKVFLTNARGCAEAKFCSTECRNARNRNEQVHKHTKLVAKVCERCGKPFEVRTSVARAQRFCSQTCAARAIGENVKGSNSPVWKERITIVCDYCGKPFETYPSRNGRAKYCCKSHSILGNFKRLATNPRTDIERAMATALEKNRIAFDEQVVMFGKFMVDFKLADYPIIIQCDGAYWHDRPTVKPRDRGQDAYLVKTGYTVLRFTDHQILHNLAGCIRAIKKAIQAPNQPRLIQD